MRNRVIAFCGSKGAGKSTSYDIFKTYYEGEIEEIALAGFLKMACAKVFGVDMEHFTNPELKEKELEDYVVLSAENVTQLLNLFECEFDNQTHVRPHIGTVLETPRRVLQYVGTEVLRPIDSLIHARIVAKNMNPDVLTVITDLRFENEFDFFNAYDSFVPVYVKNSSAEHAASFDQHPSELGLHKFKTKCVVLNNEGSLQDLEGKVKELHEYVVFNHFTGAVSA